MSLSFEQEVARRRTFAIISHPDAGKTTITEQILWHGGVIREAGQVKGKSGAKKAVSDWMTLEQQRGVSITSSVLQFDFRGLRVNLLDTPGHKDFSEDTYRTLIAADCATMLIDAAKGVEVQTRKLFEVCKLRHIPIFTFANKMDREGKEPLSLIDDVEGTLGIKCYPVTWPLGMGDRFRGLFHRLENKVYLYRKGEEEPVIHDVSGPTDEKIVQLVGAEIAATLIEELALLEGVIGEFDREEFLAGKVSPMSFGSAKHNWGIDIFLNLFADHAPSPGPRGAPPLQQVQPTDKFLSGFVFKIQANMDRKHRDRVAFLRICSGKFERGMKVKHMRLERELRLAYANQFMAQERETVDEAFAGDIVGITDTGYFTIGDCVTTGRDVKFERIPRFSPEIFARLSIKDPLKRKQLQKGLDQLSQEGTVQLLFEPHLGKQDPIIGAVGELQFDVLLFRLNDEYGLDVKLERLPFTVARWPVREGKAVSDLKGGAKIVHDGDEQPVVLVEREWDLNWLVKENPGVEFMISAFSSLDT